MICPLMSRPEGINSNVDKLFPCIGSCALLIGKECSIKILAKSKIQNTNENKNK